MVGVCLVKIKIKQFQIISTFLLSVFIYYWFVMYSNNYWDLNTIV
jgi:hypothetical protein